MISKELLSDVLSFSATPIKILGLRLFVYDDGKGKPYDNINIYELIHKCKEWLYDNGYECYSGPCIDDDDNKIYCADLYRMYGTKETYIVDEEFEADNELDAVIKACEFAINEMKDNK